MALNIVSTHHLSWQERKAESFTVSPLHSGSACKAYRRSDMVEGCPPARGQGRSRPEGFARQRIDGQQPQTAWPGTHAIERSDRQVFRAEVRIEPDDKFVAHQHNRRSALPGKFCRGLDRDFRPDAIGIANGQCNRRLGHSGNASSVSMRELSQTTVRSFSFASPSSSL